MNPDVVIVNFRSAPLIERTIAIAREFAGDQARLILVDNSPGDGASEVVRAAAPDATVVTNPINRGFATAVNQAVAAGEAEIVFLLNPDVQRVSGTYADVAELFVRDPRVGAVAARLVNPDGSEQPNCFREPRPFDLIPRRISLSDGGSRTGSVHAGSACVSPWGEARSRLIGARAPACSCAERRWRMSGRSTSGSSSTARRRTG